MNTELFIRYIIELSVFIPAGIMSVIPVRSFRKVKTGYFIVVFTVMMITGIFGGAAVCYIYRISANITLLFLLPVFFLAYNFCYDLSLPKKLLCFFNSSMLCGFGAMYSVFVTAPLEVGNQEKVSRISSGLICLGITLAIGVYFSVHFIPK